MFSPYHFQTTKHCLYATSMSEAVKQEESIQIIRPNMKKWGGNDRQRAQERRENKKGKIRHVEEERKCDAGKKQQQHDGQTSLG